MLVNLLLCNSRNLFFPSTTIQNKARQGKKKLEIHQTKTKTTNQQTVTHGLWHFPEQWPRSPTELPLTAFGVGIG